MTHLESKFLKTRAPVAYSAGGPKNGNLDPICGNANGTKHINTDKICNFVLQRTLYGSARFWLNY